MICRKCNQDKPRPKFHRLRNGSYFSWCRVCRKDYDRNRHRKRWDSGKKQDQFEANRERNRKFVFEYLSSHPCVGCGELDPIVLEFNHLGDDKLMNISIAMGRAWSMEKLMEEISKCEVLCANCHRRKTAEQFGYWILNYTSGV